jgi:hypothetical protein
LSRKMRNASLEVFTEFWLRIKVLWGYDAEYLGEWFPTFRGNVLPSFVRVEKKSSEPTWPLKVKATRSFETSASAHLTSQRHVSAYRNPQEETTDTFTQ